MAVYSLHTILAAMLVGQGETAAQQPNPPVWPSSVHVFRPQDSTSSIEAVVKAAYTLNGGAAPTDHGQFSESRYAFLFQPGTYHVDVPVGFYTQVLGLGRMPSDVIFDAPRGVFCEEGDKKDMGGALSTFWRGAENFETRASMLWAVSQAAPLRRTIVDKDLLLSQYVDGIGMGYSSGGFLGNVKILGTVHAGSQQQFCSRNAAVEVAWQDGVWNMAFIGSTGVPSSHCGRSGGQFPSTSVMETPVIAEKPFISVDDSGKYSLNVPHMRRNRRGVDFDPGNEIDFSRVFVAKATDSADIINRHLLQGLHVVLSPGVYHLDAPLQVQFDNQVVLGLGLATLVASQGTPAGVVGNVNGVRIAGILLQAGNGGVSPTLLQWGDGTFVGDPANPGFLHDLFARVGGPTDPSVAEVSANAMVHIASSHVVGDNLWLWRADHDISGLVRNAQNPVKHGLIVTGDHVTIYGLAVEHTLEDLVQWSGQHGETYFFQSELPYDVTSEFGDAGYVGYRVNDTVATHRAFATGVYHFFRDHAVTVESGISCPPWLENSFESPLGVFLTGLGTMRHVLNSRGGLTGKDAPQVQWSCDKGPFVPVPVNLGTGPPASSGLQPFARGSIYQPKQVTDADEQAAESSIPWWVSVFILQSIMICGMSAYICRLYSLSVDAEENVETLPGFGGKCFRKHDGQQQQGQIEADSSLVVRKLRSGLQGLFQLVVCTCRPVKEKEDRADPTGNNKAARSTASGSNAVRPMTPGGGHLGFRSLSPGLAGISPAAVARGLLSRTPPDARTLTPPAAFGKNKSPGTAVHSWKSSEV